MTLKSKIKELALLNAKVEVAEKILESVKFDVKRLTNERDRIEEEIRAEALQHFLATGDKQPHDAVTIRKYEKKVFDFDKVFDRMLQNSSGDGLKITKEHQTVAAGLIFLSMGADAKFMLEMDESRLKKLSEDKPLVFDGTYQEVVEYGTALKQNLGEYILFDDSASEE